MQIEQLVATFDSFIVYENFDAKTLNTMVSRLFKFLPFYKIFNYSSSDIRRILCFLLDHYEQLESSNKTKLDLFLIDFGWISHKRNNQIKNNNIVSNVLQQVYRHENMYYTKEQFALYTKLCAFFKRQENNTFYITGPASFGKTTILINSLKFYVTNNKNIVIIVPNHQIKEIYIKIKNKYAQKNINISSFTLSFIENQGNNETNILVCTAEEYSDIALPQDRIKVDTLIIDDINTNLEFYTAAIVNKYLNKMKIIVSLSNMDIESFKNRWKELGIILLLFEIINKEKFNTMQETITNKNCL